MRTPPCRPRCGRRRGLLSKLDLRDRVQAVVVAYETGLVAPELSPARGAGEG